MEVGRVIGAAVIGLIGGVRRVLMWGEVRHVGGRVAIAGRTGAIAGSGMMRIRLVRGSVSVLVDESDAEEYEVGGWPAGQAGRGVVVDEPDAEMELLTLLRSSPVSAGGWRVKVNGNGARVRLRVRRGRPVMDWRRNAGRGRLTVSVGRNIVMALVGMHVVED